jgi:hypothetical protein
VIQHEHEGITMDFENEKFELECQNFELTQEVEHLEELLESYRNPS